MPPKQGKRRPAGGTRTCPDCGGVFNVRGYGRHAKSCSPATGAASTPILNAEDNLDSGSGEGAMNDLAINGPNLTSGPQTT